ncbi:hypothetical protein [Ornithinimicrobium panacihumi]|uniref:hypothetical protein n=1 Tax=Ornithinimicrobium panacihumi TaxID=2008449 RepID=UPI003F8868F8
MRLNRLSTAVLAAGLTLGLAACGDSEDDTPTAVSPAPAPAPTEDETTDDATEDVTEEETEDPIEETTDTTEDETTDDDATEDATDDDATEDDDTAAGGDELTEPGEELSVGDPAVVQLATLADPEDDFYRYAKMRVTVTEITEAPADILDGVELATPIEDEVPYLVWADLEILETEGSHEKLDLYPQLGAVHADESPALTVFADGRAIGECESEPFEELAPGAEARMCLIALADAGEEIGGASWGGNDNADGDGDWQNNPYYDDPVLWMR